MQRNIQVPVEKHDNRQQAFPHHEVVTDVKQMPIRPIIIINHVAIQVTVDCFTPHEVTYLRVGRIICHEGRVSV